VPGQNITDIDVAQLFAPTSSNGMMIALALIAAIALCCIIGWLFFRNRDETNKPVMVLDFNPAAVPVKAAPPPGNVPRGGQAAGGAADKRTSIAGGAKQAGGLAFGGGTGGKRDSCRPSARQMMRDSSAGRGQLCNARSSVVGQKQQSMEWGRLGGIRESRADETGAQACVAAMATSGSAQSCGRPGIDPFARTLASQGGAAGAARNSGRMQNKTQSVCAHPGAAGGSASRPSPRSSLPQGMGAGARAGLQFPDDPAGGRAAGKAAAAAAKRGSVLPAQPKRGSVQPGSPSKPKAAGVDMFAESLSKQGAPSAAKKKAPPPKGSGGDVFASNV
jgi:hypothetical protein